MGSVVSQSTICWCCGTMTENSVLLQRVRLPLQRAEAVLEDVQVLRRKRDEAALGQLGGEVVVGRMIARDTCPVGRPSRPCWQTTTGRCSPGFKSFGTSRTP